MLFSEAQGARIFFRRLERWKTACHQSNHRRIGADHPPLYMSKKHIQLYSARRNTNIRTLVPMPVSDRYSRLSETLHDIVDKEKTHHRSRFTTITVDSLMWKNFSIHTVFPS